jgi:hypothetical protein
MKTRVLIYTTHKAASMFLHQLTTEVTDKLGMNYFSINDERYNDTIKHETWKKFIEDETKEGCFGPIRAGTAEPSIPEDLESYSIVLHLRDPRDVLTSLFFSYTYSHFRNPLRFNPSDEQRKQWELEGIDQFVIAQAHDVKNRYQKYCSKLFGKKNVVFLRYEEMVYDYSKWIEKFLSVFSCFISIPSIIPAIHKELFNKYNGEFSVPRENIYSHKRQVTPGDHKRKLSTQTIKELNDQFSDILELLQYDL